MGPGFTAGDGGNFSQNGTVRKLDKTKTMVCTPGFIWGSGRGKFTRDGRQYRRKRFGRLRGCG